MEIFPMDGAQEFLWKPISLLLLICNTDKVCEAQPRMNVTKACFPWQAHFHIIILQIKIALWTLFCLVGEYPVILPYCIPFFFK